MSRMQAKPKTIPNLLPSEAAVWFICGYSPNIHTVHGRYRRPRGFRRRTSDGFLCGSNFVSHSTGHLQCCRPSSRPGSFRLRRPVVARRLLIYSATKHHHCPYVVGQRQEVDRGVGFSVPDLNRSKLQPNVQSEVVPGTVEVPERVPLCVIEKVGTVVVPDEVVGQRDGGEGE